VNDLTFERIMINHCQFGMCNKVASLIATKHFGGGLEATAYTCDEHAEVIFG
jgi:hypothetical protein